MFIEFAEAATQVVQAATQAIPTLPVNAQNIAAIAGEGTANAHMDVSFIGLFMQAHFIVKTVMIGLLVASIITWATVVDKYIVFSRTRNQMDKFESVFWSGQSLEELYRTLAHRPVNGMSAVFVAAMREWKKAQEGSGKGFASLQNRIDKVMDVTITKYSGETTGRKVNLSSEVFDIEPNDHAIWLDVKSHLANQRQGTHKSKQRNEITGSSKKIKKQKGTGGARAGNIKNPQFKGGGRFKLA